jgi:hypothetical protein
MNRRAFLKLFSLGGWVLSFALLLARPPHSEVADHRPPCDPKLPTETNTAPSTSSLIAKPHNENLRNAETSSSEKTASMTPPLKPSSFHRLNNLESPHSSINWHAERLLEQIEELVHLEEPTKEAVKRAIVTQQSERYSGSFRFDDNLRAALGSQASDLEQQVNAQNNRRQEKERAREVAALSHQLKLSREQSERVGMVFERLQAALAPAQAATQKLLDEGMQKHLDPAVEKSQLREAMAIIEQSQQSLQASRQQFLATELRSILSAEQYKAWLNEASADE